MALCWGWIDAVRKGLDERSFLQRYTPAPAAQPLEPDRRRERRPSDRRGPDDRARPARGRGRQGRRRLRDRAYPSGPATWPGPDDLQAAIDAEPAARAMLERLSAQNRFALAFRTHNMKTAAGRAKLHRRLRRDAQARRDDLSAIEEVNRGSVNNSIPTIY